MGMANTHTDQPPEARVVVIGILQLPGDKELRCVREPWGWKPDIVVDQAKRTVSDPPPCFSLSDEAEAKLNSALVAWAYDNQVDEGELSA
jgi:hypothetical protein